MSTARRIAELSIAHKRNGRRWAVRVTAAYSVAMLHWGLLLVAAVIRGQGGIEFLFSEPHWFLRSCFAFDNPPADAAVLLLATPIWPILIAASFLGLKIGTITSVLAFLGNSLFWGAIAVSLFEWWRLRRDQHDSETL